MKRYSAFIMLLMTGTVYGQVTNDADGNFDSTTYVETSGTTSSTSIVTSDNTNTNNNNNVNTSTSTSTSTNTNNNNNVNTSTSTSTTDNTNTNYNILSGGTTNTNNNNNYNESVSTAVNTNNNNNVNTSTSTSVNTNTNTNINDTTINATNTNLNVSNSVSNNTNVNTVESNSTSVNTNINSSTSVSDNTNRNINESVSTSETTATTNNTNVNQNVNENRSVSESNQTQDINQKIESPPPSAIAPSIGSSYSQDLCTTGVGGAVQTQIIGISAGKSVTDENCERIKLSKTLYDMGMRVAAVSLMCQDERVWTAMKMAGTPCPYEGMIGNEAANAWEENLADVPGVKERDVEKGRVTSSPNRPR